jgi:hypothetical protein
VRVLSGSQLTISQLHIRTSCGVVQFQYSEFKRDQIFHYATCAINSELEMEKRAMPALYCVHGYIEGDKVKLIQAAKCVQKRASLPTLGHIT